MAPALASLPAFLRSGSIPAGALLWLVLGVHAAPLTADDQPAGPVELDALEKQIVLLHRAVDVLQTQLDGEHAQERDFLVQTAQQLLHDWQDPHPDAEPDLSAFPAWYLDQWQRHSGFAPLQPLGGWQRSWITLRAAERPLYDRYEELLVACHRLEHLHRRLLRQLHRQDSGQSGSAWDGPAAATLLPAP